MMTPEPSKKALEDVRQMLARATPEQTRRLLADIMRAAPLVTKEVKYDA